jgi:hypothetical protein
MTLQDFIALLDAKGCKPRQLPNGQWQAYCPAHDDAEPSLSVTESDGRILLHCFANCTVDAICAALGISVADLSGKRTERIVAVYDYRDASGRLLFQTVRYEPKRFAYRQPDNGKWRWTLEDIPRPLPLYRLPELLAADRKQPVFVAEGEKDADNLWRHGLVATTNPMGAGKWSQVDDKPLEGRQVVILPDNDEAGRKHAEQIAQSLYGRAASVRIVSLPDLPPKGDVSDWLAAGHTVGELLQLVAQTPEWHPPQPPSLAEILDAIRAFVRQYVVLTDEQADAVTLWVAHTWVTDATDVTPYLRVNSATKRCGKTRLAEVISCLARNPRFTTCISTAALFRLAHKYAGHMTLIVDEIEGTLSGKEKSTELTALLNAGWQRGLTVPRVERSRQGEFVVREFETFCPKVLVGLGRLADTVEDRAIHITLQRKKPNESVCDFYLQDAREEAKPIREALECWASDPQTMVALRLARPLMPRHISDRAREGWRLLVAIADAAGGDWSERARKAMLALEQTREDPAFNVRLLIALRDIFVEHQAERLTTLEIAEALAELPDAPVPEDFWKWLAAPDSKRKSQQIGSWLAKALKPFGIKPAIWKENGQTQRGYRLADLQDAFERYLSEMPTDPDDEGTAPNGRGDEAVSSVSAAEKEPKPENPNKIRHGFKVSTVSSTMTTPAATDPLTDPKNPLIPCHLTDREVETALFTEDETDETVETASKNPSPYLSFAVSASKAVAATDETATDPSDAPPPTSLPTDRPDPQCFTRETLPASANVRENGERANASPKTLSRIGENERSRPLNACERTNAADSGLEVQVTCPRCGAWRRVPSAAFMLADPRCLVCGEVMRLEPEGDNPKGDAPPVEDREDKLSSRKGDPPDSSAPTPADPLTGEDRTVNFAVRKGSDATAKAVAEATSVGDAPPPASPTDPNSADRPPQPDQPDANFVDAEAWIDQWASDPPPAHPTVYDLETLEGIPVADLPSLLKQEAICLHCGHREHAIPTGLLPPLCPACRSPMQWASDPPIADPNPLSLAVARLADLSDQLSDAEKEGGQG